MLSLRSKTGLFGEYYKKNNSGKNMWNDLRLFVVQIRVLSVSVMRYTRLYLISIWMSTKVVFDFSSFICNLEEWTSYDMSCIAPNFLSFSLFGRLNWCWEKNKPRNSLVYPLNYHLVPYFGWVVLDFAILVMCGRTYIIRGKESSVF